jgi:chromate transporter
MERLADPPAPLSDDARPAPRSLGEMFRAFNRLSLQGFGGVLPVAQRELVENRRWLSKAEFLELLSTGQVLPGPNIVNLGLIFGDRHFGWRGALVAMAGLILAPMAIVLALAVLYGELAHLPAVSGALRGMTVVSAGLILSTAFKLLPTLKSNVLGQGTALGVAAATFVAATQLRWPLVWILVVVGSASCLWAARRLAR